MPDLVLRMPTVLLLLTALLCFVAFMAAFRLAERGREGSLERRSGWNFMSGVVAGSGVWSSHALPLISFGDAARFEVAHTMVALIGSIVTALVVMSVWTGRDGIARAIASAMIAVIGLKFVSLITALSVSIDGISFFEPRMMAMGAAMAFVLVLAAGHNRRRTGDLSLVVNSALMALAALASSDLILGGIQVPTGAKILDGPAQINTDAIVLLVAVISFLAIATGMATALIDREGQFESQRRLRELADASVEGLVIVSDNKVVDVNESFLRIVKLTRQDVRGSSFLGELLISDLSPDRVPSTRLIEGQLQAPHGLLVPVEVVPRPVEYQGRPHIVFAVRDLSDRRDAELRIRFLAEHDALTGLPNRARFNRELEWRCAELEGSGLNFVLYCVDLDRFKEANDVFGHLAGDEVLIQASSRLRELIDAGGFVARLGGDEFAILMDDIQSPRIAGDFGERIITVLSVPYEFAGQRIGVGASLGMAMAPGDGRKAEVLLARADMALYRAKNEGRGGYRFFEESMDEETRLRRSLAFDLRDAIERDELELYYQPLAEVGSKAIVGFEALARWHHPKHGMISPTVFIAIAEESGYIAQLGAWVLRTACAEAATWKQPLGVAVNLSPVQLEQQNLPEVLHEILLTTGLPPKRLEIEVTETSLLRNPQRALDVLRRIKALGIRIAMDDFGTGYSSLSTLQAFPFDKLKIDRSFVDRVASNEQAASIVRAVVGLSRSLDIRVLAEGVETEFQFNFLVGESCDEVQGFMFGRPLPIQSYAAIVDGTNIELIDPVLPVRDRDPSISDPVPVAELLRARS